MKLKSILSAAVLLASMAINQTVKAQSSKYNSEIGFSYCMASADYKVTNKFFNEDLGLLIDSTITERITSKGGFGGMLGHHFRLKRMGEYSSIALSIAFMYDALLWESSSFSYSSGSSGTTSSGSGTVRMGLPVGVDYKFGCDAVADKSRRMCATLGAGVYPSLALTVFRDEASGGFKMLPYLKGEIGVFAGICMKLRGTMTFGNINYIDYSNEISNYNYSTSLIGKSTFTVSLVFMPMSWKWGRNEWWGR